MFVEAGSGVGGYGNVELIIIERAIFVKNTIFKVYKPLTHWIPDRKLDNERSCTEKLIGAPTKFIRGS